MSATELYEQVKNLPLAERIELAHRLCEDIAEEQNEPDLTSAQRAELDRRAERALAHSDRCRPLEDVILDIEAKFRARK